MTGPFIPINTATAEEIAELHDVGPVLAERIVSFREAHGPFKGPEDLGQVDGITQELAIVLSPYIDWLVPVAPALPKKRLWHIAMLYLLGAAVLMWAIYFKSLPLLGPSLQGCQAGSPRYCVWVWIAASALVCLAFLFLMITIGAGYALAVNRMQATRLRKALLPCYVLALLAAVSFVLASAVFLQFCVNHGWATLIEDPRGLTVIGMFVVLPFFAGPLLLTWWQPTLFYNAWLSRFFDAWLVIVGPLMIWAIWVNRVIFPIWILAFFSIVGLYAAWRGMTVIRGGRSFFQGMARMLLDPASLARLGVDTARWQAWINARLPNPEDQKALQRALSETYPPSRARAIVALIVIGAGGWLLATSLSAIVEWVIQTWLNQWL